MNDWQRVRLGELCQLVNGDAHKDSDWSTAGVPIVRIQNLNDASKPFNYWAGSLDNKVTINSGDVLLAWSGTPGTSFGTHIWKRGLGVLNQHIFRVDIDKELITAEWTVFAVNEQLNILIQKSHGGVGLQHVTKGEVENLEIILPPLPEQRRIAALLDKADKLRRTRRYAAQLSETFLQAVFVRMFGDARTNPMGWDTEFLENLIASGDKINYGVVQPGDDLPNGMPIIRIGDFDGFGISLGSLKRIAPAIEEKHKKSRLHGDEILIACVGSIGRIAFVDQRMKGLNIVRAIARVRCNDSVNRYYLGFYFATPHIQRHFNSQTRTVNQPTLNIEQIEETPVLLPPLALQEKFARIVQQFERLRAQQREAERQAEHLFQMLLHRAFTT